MVKRVSRFLWLYVYVLFALMQKVPKNQRTCRVFFIVITFFIEVIGWIACLVMWESSKGAVFRPETFFEVLLILTEETRRWKFPFVWS